MIAEILERLQRDFPPSNSSGDVDHCKTSLSTYAHSLHAIGSMLLDTIRRMVPARLFAESALEVVAPARPEITIAQFRLRPNDHYYESVGALLPSPANPAVPHATGIAFNLSLYRGAVQQLVRLPGLEFSSACWFDGVENPASRNSHRIRSK
ncbi:MAG: hypothetical protein JNN30_09170 [Rhodanobacteraceae bacterium]|nr:hypothetical protein [Rhodanobacteraceae bacterium]